jgi:hypothetical protein
MGRFLGREKIPPAGGLKAGSGNKIDIKVRMISFVGFVGFAP